MGYADGKLTNNPNVFHIHLESEDCMTKDLSGGRFVFNVGSVLDRAPQLNDLSKYSHSTIKLVYFDIAESAADWKTAGVEVLILKIANNYPNNTQSSLVGSGQQYNVVSSDIVGYVPTLRDDWTYGPNYVNEPVILGNFLNGEISISIYKSFETALELTAGQVWRMVLEVCYYPKEEERDSLLKKELKLGGF
tara:strand:- start:1156 stop:1731 length:576 start_codon:yes stop_codon:yes gene_type:complete